MNAIDRYWATNQRRREPEHTLDEAFVSKVCGNPPMGPKAIAQAAYSAHDLEQDREATRGR